MKMEHLFIKNIKFIYDNNTRKADNTTSQNIKKESSTDFTEVSFEDLGKES